MPSLAESLIDGDDRFDAEAATSKSEATTYSANSARAAADMSALNG